MSDKITSILVIEDSAADREMFRRVLGQICAADVQVCFAADLATARQRLDEHLVAFIILDNVLPDGRGADFISELAQHRDWQKIPVLVVSDWPTPFMFDKVRNARAKAILSKDDFRAPVIRPYIENIPHAAKRA
ncbi:hypothetical protein AL036_19695 [Salipiger aestuarii]|uniref:Response regulator receiver domain-containing protein n=1 Tax=Salipiger aestuarii TaxID=568098 RepID=A0A327XMG1_9RHOB|nr:response regulator [Salipiger aestuarii]EIE49919.1 Signal transduction histidine kinase [Citreicella sp. 357]KAA8605303.1 hypothetical protein AL036_19695 [Salipiger aestuarii]KAA8607608.1 hypothetical protein AL037_18525 [Salipiger aestuarii]KAB2538446.1 hypothetical protein AL035_19250 [Salipiger aestuarii]RAK09442.1 response regulator receiver domain-containing protein [Salipiger aestuarii]